MDDRSVAQGYCRCGCGSWLGFWEKNDRIHGYIKDEPKRFAPGHNARGIVGYRDSSSNALRASTPLLRLGPTVPHFRHRATCPLICCVTSMGV